MAGRAVSSPCAQPVQRRLGLVVRRAAEHQPLVRVLERHEHLEVRRGTPASEWCTACCPGRRPQRFARPTGARTPRRGRDMRRGVRTAPGPADVRRGPRRPEAGDRRRTTAQEGTVSAPSRPIPEHDVFPAPQASPEPQASRTAQAPRTLDTYRLPGRSGLRGSPPALGAATFGTEWGRGAERDEARRLFDRYRERGGDFVDTDPPPTPTAAPSGCWANSPATTAKAWCRRRNTRHCAGPATRIPGDRTARTRSPRWKPVCAG